MQRTAPVRCRLRRCDTDCVLSCSVPALLSSLKRLAPEQLFGDEDTDAVTTAIAAVPAASNLFEFYDAIGRRRVAHARPRECARLRAM
jgi:hypothetical protein